MEVYLYSVHWFYDSLSGGRMMTCSGVVAAESMSNAVEKLTTELYENVEWVQVYSLEGSDSGYIDVNDINAAVLAHNLVSEE